MPVDLKAGFGRRDVVLLTLDALRYDVAVAAQTPVLAGLVGAWERRHSPATFTLPAHEAIFAGFFPTPVDRPDAVRPIAMRFPGSRSTGPATLVLNAPCLVRGYAAAGYRTICVGGTGFFDPTHPIGAALTARFDVVVRTPAMGVGSPTSPRAQLDAAADLLDTCPPDQRALLFVNLSATHPPTRPFLRGAREESTATQAAALVAIDRALPTLLAAIDRRGGASLIMGADHGTCFGEDGVVGHRVPHPKVWEVPWAEVERTAMGATFAPETP
jgi:hypothetical protein